MFACLSNDTCCPLPLCSPDLFLPILTLKLYPNGFNFRVSVEDKNYFLSDRAGTSASCNAWLREKLLSYFTIFISRGKIV